MTLQYRLAFQLLMAVALLGKADARRGVVTSQDQSKARDEIVAVSYCDLVKDKAKFDGKSVRVTATMLS